MLRCMLPWLRSLLGVPTADELDSQVSLLVAAQLAIRTPAGPPVVVDDNPENPANWLSVAYVHDRVLEQLVAQNDRWEAADGRLRLILGLISVVFAVTIGLVPKTASSASDQVYLPFWVGAPAVAAAAVFLIAGLIAVRAYWPASAEHDFRCDVGPRVDEGDQRQDRLNEIAHRVQLRDDVAGTHIPCHFLGVRFERWSTGAAIRALAAGT
jgi:hypothetical protein